MAYCIMRFEKIKAASVGGLAGSLAHTMRSRYTPNADPELIKDNKVLLGPQSTVDVVRAVRERWPEKHRKDAVGCIEYFIGASPEWFKKHGGHGDQDAYFQHAIDWLKAEYGAENVISVVQHNDETSPHLAAYVVPIDPASGNLNAKLWTGGRSACGSMQTRFHEAAGNPVGLDRGVRGSKAEHLTIQRWYEAQADLDKREQEIEQKQWKDEASLTAREEDLGLREHSFSVSNSDLLRREKTLSQKAAKIESQGRELAERAELLAEGEKRLQEQTEAVEQQKAALVEREQRISILERQIAEREGGLKVSETELAGREESLAKAGAALSAKIANFKAKQQDWVESNKPQVPAIVEQLRQLETMGVIESAEYLEAQDNDDLYACFDAQDGLTAQGKALMAKYNGIEEQREKFDQVFTPGSTPGL